MEWRKGDIKTIEHVDISLVVNHAYPIAYDTTLRRYERPAFYMRMLLEFHAPAYLGTTDTWKWYGTVTIDLLIPGSRCYELTQLNAIVMLCQYVLCMSCCGA